MKTETIKIKETITNRKLLKKLENAFGYNEMPGDYFEKVTNIKIIQKTHIYKNDVKCEFLVEFDALVDGDFGEDYKGNWITKKWYRFNKLCEGPVYNSYYDKEEDYIGVESDYSVIMDMTSYDICKALIDILEHDMNYDIIYSGVEESHSKYVMAH